MADAVEIRLDFDYLYYEALSKTLSEWESPEDEEAYRDL